MPSSIHPRRFGVAAKRKVLPACVAAAMLATASFAPPALAQHEHHAPQPVPATGHEADDHTGHAIPPRSPPSSPAPPPPTAEELAAAFPDLHGMRMQDHMDDDPVLTTLQLDRLEWQHAREASGLGWELQGWIGDLENRVWLRSEGERRDGSLEHGDIELLWGRPTGPWWDALVGMRHDFGDGPGRDWLAFGVQGLAPYKFEVAATAYLGSDARFAARAEAEYELLLTNRLILQPRLEANLYGKDDSARRIGKGLSDAALGVRLRYEFHRQVAPYVGYEWSRKFGRTAELAEDAGEARSDRIWVAGIRFWF